MVVLRKCAALGTPLRMEEDLRELGKSTLSKLRQAIEEGDKELALALADYLYLETKRLHDIYTDWTYIDLAWVARSYGEEEVPKLLRFVRAALDAPVFAKYAGLAREDVIKVYAESMRAQGGGPTEQGDFKMWEEADRYVMEFDPCGSGGRMARGPLDGSGSRAGPPHNFGRTSKPYPWSWGKAGVPYYCTHCCLFSEILPLEKNGYPLRITEAPVDDPSKPCYWYFYKDPVLIPEEYFVRVGFRKDPAKFKGWMPKEEG